MATTIERETIEITTVDRTQAWDVVVTQPEKVVEYTTDKARELADAIRAEADRADADREAHIAALTKSVRTELGEEGAQ